MNQEPKNEAGPEKTDQQTASIEEKLEVLGEVESEVRTARFLVRNQKLEDLKLATLARAFRKIHDLIGPWQNLVDPPATVIDPAAGTGGVAFYTPKGALDVVTANPPIGAGKIPLGAEPWRSLPTDSIGIRASARLVQAWVVRDGASIDVRAVRVCMDTAESVSSWKVIASVDCEEAFVGVIYGGVRRANAVCRALRNGLLAARLRGRHYRQNCAARAAAAASAAHFVGFGR